MTRRFLLPLERGDDETNVIAFAPLAGAAAPRRDPPAPRRGVASGRAVRLRNGIVLAGGRAPVGQGQAGGGRRRPDEDPFAGLDPVLGSPDPGAAAGRVAHRGPLPQRERVLPAASRARRRARPARIAASGARGPRGGAAERSLHPPDPLRVRARRGAVPGLRHAIDFAQMFDASITLQRLRGTAAPEEGFLPSLLFGERTSARGARRTSVRWKAACSGS
jgi:hypothetical protein